MSPIRFRCKRAWKELFGSFLIAACAAGVLVLVGYGVAMCIGVWLTNPIGLLLVVETLVLLAVLLVVVPVMLFGLSLFGRFSFELLREIWQRSSALELLPEGIRGSTNLPGVDLIPWDCIASVQLEAMGERAVLGIQTTKWPPVPIWKKCSRATRRVLWTRYNRRQPPLILDIRDADAPPEVILHTIEEELNRARERGLTPRPPEEGGTL